MIINQIGSFFTKITGGWQFGDPAVDASIEVTNGDIALDGTGATGLTYTMPSSSQTLVGRSSTDTLTNKTIDANGTGNSITNIETGDIAAATLVTAADTIASNDNDTTLPTSAAVRDLVESLYPVGSIYINSSVATNPGTLLGFGTWSAFGAGRVLVGFDSGQTEFDAAEETGGAKTHTLTTTEMPSHTHGIQGTNFASSFNGGSAGASGTTGSQYPTTLSAGSGGAHNNLQPYITVYMWKRTA